MLVTGPTGSGKSSTLAAVIDLINETRAEHILTIEDPVEFLHLHKKGTVHQRELHSDTPTFALALRAALRQAPKVILVGEMRDRETIEIALTAAETGHLVFSTLHTIDASKTVERIVGTFEAADQQAVRSAPGGVVPLFRLPAPDPEDGRRPHCGAGNSQVDDAHAGVSWKRARRKASRCSTPCATASWTACSTSTARSRSSCANRVISLDTGLLYATNAGNLQVQLADFAAEESDSLITR